MQKFIDFKNGLIAFLSDKHEWLASRFTELFHTPWPYVFILVVSLLAMLPIFDKRERKGFWGLLMSFVLVSFPVAVFLMEVALLTLGRMGSVWWCDPEGQGFFHAFMKFLVFVAFLVVQWVAVAIYFYKLKQETDEDNAEKWSSINFLPLFAALVVFYPFSSWVIYHVGGWIHLPGIVAIVLWMLIPIVGLLYSWAINTSSFGIGRGLLFTMISICVAVGLLAGLCIMFQAIRVLFWSISTIVVVILVFAFIIFIAMAYNEKDGGTGSDGTHIIFYWFENPGCLGFIMAIIIAYLILHFWLKVF